MTCYPPGSRYTKHVDNGGRMSNGRRLTTLLYLNEDWAPGDGGCVGGSCADVCPPKRACVAALACAVLRLVLRQSSLCCRTCGQTQH